MTTPKRRHIVAGNWKMNKNYDDGRDLVRSIVEKLQNTEVVVILCPPFIHLYNAHAKTNDMANLFIGAQNCHQEASGAYTGEVSAGMLKSTGADFVILGHSERRAYFNESDELIGQKVKAAIANDLQPIFCCGEPLEVREAEKHEALVEKQVKNALFDLSEEDFKKVVIAYEPVWAIGTGKTASPEQAQEMHHHIRQLVSNQYGKEVADGVSILYGGSVKPGNAKEIFAKPDVDGGLIGGAALKAADFLAIVNSF
jgi:triosephosphate isomerase